MIKLIGAVCRTPVAKSKTRPCEPVSFRESRKDRAAFRTLLLLPPMDPDASSTNVILVPHCSGTTGLVTVRGLFPQRALAETRLCGGELMLPTEALGSGAEASAAPVAVRLAAGMANNAAKVIVKLRRGALREITGVH